LRILWRIPEMWILWYASHYWNVGRTRNGDPICVAVHCFWFATVGLLDSCASLRSNGLIATFGLVLFWAGIWASTYSYNLQAIAQYSFHSESIVSALLLVYFTYLSICNSVLQDRLTHKGCRNSRNMLWISSGNCRTTDEVREGDEAFEAVDIAHRAHHWVPGSFCSKPKNMLTRT
jgi:hypothetical protein